MKSKIAVIYGSVRSQRRGIRAAKFIVKKLEERGHEVKLIDPLEYKFPLLDKMYKEYEDAPDVMQEVHKILDNADGFIIVSAEYNHGLPAALKNILDHYSEEFHFKPSGIVSYSKGPFAGLRGAMHLRAVLPELGTISIPTIFPISGIDQAFDENGNAQDDAYNRRVNRFLDEFEWYVNSLKEQRKKGLPY